MTYHHFRVHAGLHNSESYIELDGRCMKGVTSVAVELSPRKVSELTLTIRGYIDFTGKFRDSEIIRVVRRKMDE